MKNAAISFGVMALLLLICLVKIFDIILNPASFVFVFTLAVIACITGLAFWNGP